MNRQISEDDKMKSNYAEYIVKKKSDTKLVLSKLGIILIGVAVFALGAFLLLSLIKLPVAMVPLCLIDGVLMWYLWRYVNIEYEYIVISGTIEFYTVYGERQRKKLFEIKISDIEKVLPYEDSKDIAKGIDDVTSFCIAVPSENLFCIIVNENGKKRVIYINAIKKALDAIRYYKASAVSYGSLK